MADDERLFTTRWVHVFEEDTPEGAVYRPEDDNIPLSRRPRERLELSADGTAKVLTPGPDDRLVEKPATWTSGKKEKKEAAAASTSADIRIVEQSPSRLIIRRPARG
jgi:hypothetical protein